MTIASDETANSRAGAAKGEHFAGCWSLRGMWRGIALVSVLVLTAAGLLYPFPLQGLIWSEVFNLAHAPVFAVLLVVITALRNSSVRGGRGRGLPQHRIGMSALLIPAGFLAVFGIAGELGQQFTGRNANWGDVCANLAGLVVGILIVTAISTTGRSRLLGIGSALLILLAVSAGPLLRISEGVRQRFQMPQLCSFERESELILWEPLNTTLERTREWSTDGIFALKIPFTKSRFSGASMIWPAADWRGYGHLLLDLHNISDRGVTLTLKIQDQRHAASDYDPADRFQQSIDVPAGAVRQVQVDLQQAVRLANGRTMDLSDIARLELFTTDLQEPAVLLLDHLRLAD